MTVIKIKYFLAISFICFTSFAQDSLSLRTKDDFTFINPIKIVMLGNSITHGGNWQVLLNREDVAERGVVSDVLPGFLRRVQYIYKLNPKIIFIEGGINDIYNNESADYVFSNYKILIEDILSKKIKVVVQSTLFVNTRYHHSAEKNEVVKQLDKLLKQYCKEKKIEFLELNLILSPEGILKSEYTFDGVHLTAPAYLLWAEQVHDLLKDINF